MKKTLSFFLLFSSVSAFAALPEYQAPEILARANIGEGYNLPPMSFISNTCPVINNRGDVAFKLMGFDGASDQGFWLKRSSDDAGKIVYTAPDSRLLTEPSLNDKGQLAFNQYDEGVTDGVFTWDADSSVLTQVLKPDAENIIYYTFPQVLTNGKVFFRGTDNENARTYYQYDGTLKPVIAEGVTAYGQKSSYLFRPYLNDSGSMAFKRRLGEAGEWDESNGDEILLLKAKGNSYESIVVAKDKDSDPQSLFKGFTNSASISKSGMVSFVGILQDGAKAIILYKDGKLKNLAIEKADDIGEIEMFNPKLNDQGVVVFRAKNTEGKRGIYVADGASVKRLIGEGDEIMTDLGPATILYNPNFPGFGGDVDMNDQGEIVFYCLVMGKEGNQEWGSAVYKLSPVK